MMWQQREQDINQEVSPAVALMNNVSAPVTEPESSCTVLRFCSCLQNFLFFSFQAETFGSCCYKLPSLV